MLATARTSLYVHGHPPRPPLVLSRHRRCCRGFEKFREHAQAFASYAEVAGPDPAAKPMLIAISIPGPASKHRALKVLVTDISSAVRPSPHPVSSIPGPLFLLNAEEISEEIGNMWRTIYKLTKTFADVPAPRRLAENVKVKIDKFKQHIPILSISCNPGMKDRHWHQVPVPVPGRGGPPGGGHRGSGRIVRVPASRRPGVARARDEQPLLHAGRSTLLFRDPAEYRSSP